MEYYKLTEKIALGENGTLRSIVKPSYSISEKSFKQLLDCKLMVIEDTNTIKKYMEKSGLAGYKY